MISSGEHEGHRDVPDGESQDYRDGWADGQAGKDPDFERLALGWNRPNDYERGYFDSGQAERERPRNRDRKAGG